MKKLWALLAATALIASFWGTTAMAAGSASVSISSITSVQQGRSYTYTISVKISGSNDFIGKIEFGGAFSSRSMITLDFHPASASGTTLSNKVTFKIPSNAAIGDTGTITVSGQGSYLDESSNVKEYHVSKSLTATVVAYIASTPRPSSKATSSVSAAPTPTPPPTLWDIAGQSVSGMPEGGTASVDATQDPKIPAAVLKALKDKKGKLTVTLGACTCTIDGATLGSIPDTEPLDLSVTMDKDPNLSTAAGGADAFQLHFAYSGPLPGKFTYTFKADGHNPGDTLYLYYYYDKSGILEGVASATVASDGTVSFDIYHCSSYVVTAAPVAGAAGSLADAVSAAQAAQDAQKQLADVDAQLKNAKSGAEQLDSQLKQQETQLKDAQTQNAALQAEVDKRLAVSPTVLATAGLAVVLVTVLLTMLLCGAGPFGRKPAHARTGGQEDGQEEEPDDSGKEPENKE